MKIKIGCFEYCVDEVECVNKFEPRKGEIDFYDRVIRIDKGMSELDKIETLIHEAIHGLDEFMQIGLDEEHVKKIGHGLAMLLRDNPELVNRLFSPL